MGRECEPQFVYSCEERPISQSVMVFPRAILLASSLRNVRVRRMGSVPPCLYYVCTHDGGILGQLDEEDEVNLEVKKHGGGEGLEAQIFTFGGERTSPQENDDEPRT